MFPDVSSNMDRTCWSESLVDTNYYWSTLVQIQSILHRETMGLTLRKSGVRQVLSLG